AHTTRPHGQATTNTPGTPARTAFGIKALQQPDPPPHSPEHGRAWSHKIDARIRYPVHKHPTTPKRHYSHQTPHTHPLTHSTPPTPPHPPARTRPTHTGQEEPPGNMRRQEQEREERGLRLMWRAAPASTKTTHPPPHPHQGAPAATATRTMDAQNQPRKRRGR